MELAARKIHFRDFIRVLSLRSRGLRIRQELENKTSEDEPALFRVSAVGLGSWYAASKLLDLWDGFSRSNVLQRSDDAKVDRANTRQTPIFADFSMPGFWRFQIPFE